MSEQDSTVTFTTAERRFITNLLLAEKPTAAYRNALALSGDPSAIRRIADKTELIDGMIAKLDAAFIAASKAGAA